MSGYFWLTQEQLDRIAPYFPLSRGVPRVDDLRVISGIIHVIRRGLQWRDAPADYGPPKTLYNRFVRWSRMGIFNKIFTDPDQLALLDQIESNGNDVYEACSFQDITGQRVSKIVKSVTYVEERVCVLIDIWGKDEIAKIDVAKAEETEDEKLLRGPALETDESLGQADIDFLSD